jgi:hypothetical protein
VYLVELKVGLVEVHDRIEEFSHILRQSPRPPILSSFKVHFNVIFASAPGFF